MDFKDEILRVVDETVVVLPKMTGEQYEKKVKQYIEEHREDEVIRRLRKGSPLTPADLRALEETLVGIGKEDGKELYVGLLQRNEAPSLAYFVRTLVGMDRAAAQAAFAEYLSGRTLTPQQMRFIEQLTARGVMEEGVLYDQPFTDLHSGGPDGVFAGRKAVMDGIFERLRRVRDDVLAMAA